MQQEKKCGTNPDILLLMLYCSHMSDANTVSWGPTMLSSFLQNSSVGGIEAVRQRKGRCEILFPQLKVKFL